jgi:hypothetical protein
MSQVFRVSHLAQFAHWKEDDESDVGWLVNSIISNEETEAMRKGTAFHKYLEHAKSGDMEEFSVDGYRFVFTADIEISLPVMREMRRSKDYGGIIVSGQCDGIVGAVVYDHKTTERFDAEKYLEGWQHKFYLDIFNANQFTWLVWEMKEIEEGSKAYEVFGLHQLTQYRYPGMYEECRNLAQEFKQFADRYLKGYTFQ